jgi:ABC-type nickel/cobalt efflux system permease component RcnA
LSVALFLVTSLLLGMRHALDPDHVVAVSTLAAEERRLWPVARLGFIWGLGHIVPLALLGIPVLLLRLELPAQLEQVVDLGVGVLLIALGVRTLWRLRQERMHIHLHNHDGHEHVHFHAHGQDMNHSPAHHRHTWDRRSLMTFAVGVVHGLAGSGAAAVLALAAAPSVTGGVVYLLAFGAGTCLGMFAMTLFVAAPAMATISRFGAMQFGVRMVSGLASVALGAFMWFEILPHLVGG